MKKIFKENLFFLIPFLIFVLSTSIVLIIFSKAEIHIFFNSHHSSFLDTIIPVFTYAGDGSVAFVLMLAMLFVKYRYAIAAAIANILSIILTYIFKQILFNNEPRPRKYFTEIYNGNYELYIVPGTNPETLDSFPSGHTTTAFVVYFFIAIIAKNKFVKFSMFLLAWFTGYTRIYMSNHFLQDVFGGAVLGVTITTCAFLISQKFKSAQIEKSLIRR